jgi:hypothetical protein
MDLLTESELAPAAMADLLSTNASAEEAVEILDPYPTIVPDESRVQPGDVRILLEIDVDRTRV